MSLIVLYVYALCLECSSLKLGWMKHAALADNGIFILSIYYVIESSCFDFLPWIIYGRSLVVYRHSVLSRPGSDPLHFLFTPSTFWKIRLLQHHCYRYFPNQVKTLIIVKQMSLWPCTSLYSGDMAICIHFFWIMSLFVFLLWYTAFFSDSGLYPTTVSETRENPSSLLLSSLLSHCVQMKSKRNHQV